MSKKQIKIHQKGSTGGLYQPHRLDSVNKNFGNKQVRKSKKS